MTFAPVFQRPFSATFDRRAAAAAAASWWLAGGAPTPVAVYQAKGAASLAASYVNLANPGTYDAAPGIAPSFNAATGWTGDGTQYLVTGIVPPFSGGATEYSMLVMFSDANTNGGTLLGEFTSGARFDIVARQLFQNRRSYGNGDPLLIEPRISSGVMAIAGSQGYLNAAADGGAIPVGFTTNAQQIGIFARGNGTDIAAAKIQAVAIWNTSTNHATWMPAVSAAVALI